jgi:hypothetical protein
MNVQVTRVDVERTRAAWPGGEFLPAHVYPRADDKSNWYVLDAPYEAGKEPSLASTAADAYIRIPLFCYKLSATGDVALAHMLRLGLLCGNQFSKISQLHIVTGHPVELVYQNNQLSHMNYWVGFAFIAAD